MNNAYIDNIAYDRATIVFESTFPPNKWRQYSDLCIKVGNCATQMQRHCSDKVTFYAYKNNFVDVPSPRIFICTAKTSTEFWEGLKTKLIELGGVLQLSELSATVYFLLDLKEDKVEALNQWLENYGDAN